MLLRTTFLFMEFIRSKNDLSSDGKFKRVLLQVLSHFIILSFLLYL